MSTDMYPAEQGFTAQMPQAQQDPTRTLRIAANLLPDEIMGGRRARRTRTAAVAGVGAVVLVLAGWYATTFVKAQGADEELAAAEVRSRAVQQEQQQYSELTGVKTELSTAKDRLGALMAHDSQWQRLLSDVRGAAPAEVTISALSGGISNQVLAQGNQLPSQVTEEVVGTVTLIGSAADKAKVAQYVDNLRAVTGLANPLPTDITSEESGAETFTIQVDITQAALGGRFTPEATATPVPGTTTGGN
ncbi:PilN domain-containing protein [Catenuloplanes indicus]|uniref:Tfp pilus assembly protein PilN n=1 Tax=Catenuloplanes indicus TaxID=137267 RepID=A0AAE3W5V7_9ACTN|nr:PilN domain-containing protein [Catenuloplanes indicus]MDQ0370468.1 Tfp pilus assembly protein PilN [Catenuloplanes indicus]